MAKRIIIILVIFGFLFPSFAFLQNQSVKSPETLEEAKEMGEEALGTAQKKLSGILERIWKEEVLPFWGKMWDGARGWWNSSIFPWLQNIWQKILGLLGKEVEKRKPVIEEELQKEKEEIKEEMKEELPKIGESLWERFKGLIK